MILLNFKLTTSLGGFCDDISTLQMRQGKKQQSIPIPKELASIVRNASPLTNKEEPIGAHLDAINKLKQQETMSFLRAAMMRLKKS